MFISADVETMLMYQRMEGFINLEKLGAKTWHDLYVQGRMETDQEIIDSVTKSSKTHSKRSRRSNLAGKDGVMYVNLDGGSGGESCPSVADSAAVSLSQMAFLSMSVSIFSTVANIANNLNNNNNNQNDNNLNYVHQQNNNLNMNQNIINQLNIDLPPPVPGKRSISDVFSMAKVEDMQRRQLYKISDVQIKKMMNATSSQADCNTDYTAKASEALLDILKVAVYNQIENEGSRACLGKQLCQSRIS